MEGALGQMFQSVGELLRYDPRAPLIFSSGLFLFLFAAFTFFYRYMRPLIEEGYVYIAMPPLYKVERGKHYLKYAYTDEELEKILDDIGRDNKGKAAAFPPVKIGVIRQRQFEIAIFIAKRYGCYCGWKAVGYDSDVLDINETTAELFLWADGSGFFRITQESARVGDYGFPDSFDCRWSKNESSLLLTGVDPTDRGSDEMTGIFEDGRLALAYKGLYGDSFSIFFEQADMPVEVAQEDKQIFESSWELFEAAGGDILTFSRWLYGEASGQRGVLNPDGSYSYSETLDDGNVEFTLTREKTLQISDMVAVAEFFGERSGEISDLNVSPDDALSEALGYPAYEVSYGTLGNVGSRAHKAVFVGADEWDFIVEVAVNEEVYGNYWVDVEQLLDNLTWLSTD